MRGDKRELCVCLCVFVCSRTRVCVCVFVASTGGLKEVRCTVTQHEGGMKHKHMHTHTHTHTHTRAHTHTHTHIHMHGHTHTHIGTDSESHSTYGVRFESDTTSKKTAAPQRVSLSHTQAMQCVCVCLIGTLCWLKYGKC